jgi:hypothetical protein
MHSNRTPWLRRRTDATTLEVGLVIRLAAALLLAGPTLAQGDVNRAESKLTVVGAAELINSDTGKSIPIETLEGRLAQGSAMAKLDAGAEFSAFDFRAKAQQPTRVHISASSEFLILAVLSGQLSLNGKVAKAGEALVGSLASGAIVQAPYDVNRLAGTVSPAIAIEVSDTLRPVMVARRKAAFFDKYPATGVNAAAPGSPLTEPARRQMLLEPTIVALRRTADNDGTRLKNGVAARFAAALDDNDASTAAILLDPAPFLGAGRDWSTTRSAFAQANIAGWRGRGPTTVESVDGDSALLNSGTHKARLTFVQRDDFYFVASLEVSP